MSEKIIKILNEKQAIARLKRGDIGGLEWLVHTYQTRALRTAFLIVHDQKLAEDIVQSAFLKAYEHIHQFESHRPFAPWFFKIVSNDAIKEVKHNRGRASLETEEFDARSPINLLSTDQQLPESLVVQAETADELWDLLQKLSPEQRAVLVLRYYEALTITEIANDLNIAPGTLRWRVHAALKRLRGLVKWSRRTRYLESLVSKSTAEVTERES